MILLYGQKVGRMALTYLNPTFAFCYDDHAARHARAVMAINSMMLLSVHGREILGPEILEKFDCYNIHPYLYCYKGADPIGRAMQAGNSWASVGLHRMTEHVDSGEVLFEVFAKLKAMNDYDSIYAQLYPLYYACFEKMKRIV